MSDGWSLEETTRLIDLWQTHSATQIAKVIDRTREAVCGKVHRLQAAGIIPKKFTARRFDLPPVRPQHIKVAKTLPPPPPREEKNILQGR